MELREEDIAKAFKETIKTIRSIINLDGELNELNRAYPRELGKKRRVIKKINRKKYYRGVRCIEYS